MAVRIAFIIHQCATVAHAFGSTPEHALPPPTFMIPDLHGDLNRTKEALLLTGLVDKKMNWLHKGKLVQIGDMSDKWHETVPVLDLFMHLKRQANDSLVVLLGNHELYNIRGDYSHMHGGAEEMAYFDRNGSMEEQKFARALAFAKDGKYGEWLLEHGRICYKQGPPGKETIYTHAGISAAWASLGCDGINMQMKAELQAAASTQAEVRAARAASRTRRMCCNETHHWVKKGTGKDYCPDIDTGIPSVDCYTAITQAQYKATRKVDCDAAPFGSSVLNDGSEAVGDAYSKAATAYPCAGPFFYRGYHWYTDDVACPELYNALKLLGAQRMVGGHTPQYDGNVGFRCGDKYLVADIGMSKGFGTEGNGLESAKLKYVSDELKDEFGKEEIAKNWPRVVAVQFYPWTDTSNRPKVLHPPGYKWPTCKACNVTTIGEQPDD